MRCLLLTGLFFFLGVNLLYGQNVSLTGLEAENHEELGVLVEGLSQDALDIRLTKSRIESKVKVRLRQVGIRPNSEMSNTLYIQVNVAGGGFNINLSFKRTVYFDVGEELYLSRADAYTRGVTGTHGRDPELIISGLDTLLDEFLSDYLDAND